MRCWLRWRHSGNDFLPLTVPARLLFSRTLSYRRHHAPAVRGGAGRRRQRPADLAGDRTGSRGPPFVREEMGLMRKRITWLAVLLGLGVGVAPQAARAQPGIGGLDVPPAALSTSIPWPFGRPRLEQGGFYVAGEFMYWRQTNPLGNQPLAFPGIVDF